MNTKTQNTEIMKPVHFSAGESVTKQTFDLQKETPRRNKQYLTLDSGHTYEVPDGFVYKVGEQYKGGSIVEVQSYLHVLERKQSLEQVSNNYNLTVGENVNPSNI